MTNEITEILSDFKTLKLTVPLVCDTVKRDSFVEEKTFCENWAVLVQWGTSIFDSKHVRSNLGHSKNFNSKKREYSSGFNVTSITYTRNKLRKET